jgi:hypothetical protein
MTQFFAQESAVAYVAGFIFGVPLAQLLLPRILRYVWLRVLDHNGIPRGQIHKDIEFLAALVGLLERTLYMAAILVGATEFIGVWRNQGRRRLEGLVRSARLRVV